MFERDQYCLHHFRLAYNAQGDLGHDPERSLGADDDACYIIARGVEGGATHLDELTIGEHQLQAENVVDGEAIFEAMGTTRVLSHVAADGADRLARRIRRIKVAVGCDSLRHPCIDDSRLHDHPLVEEIHSENLIHACDWDQHAALHRECTTREPGARPTWHKREALPMADAHYRLDLFR